MKRIGFALLLYLLGVVIGMMARQTSPVADASAPVPKAPGASVLGDLKIKPRAASDGPETAPSLGTAGAALGVTEATSISAILEMLEKVAGMAPDRLAAHIAASQMPEPFTNPLGVVAHAGMVRVLVEKAPRKAEALVARLDDKDHILALLHESWVPDDFEAQLSAGTWEGDEDAAADSLARSDPERAWKLMKSEIHVGNEAYDQLAKHWLDRGETFLRSKLREAKDEDIQRSLLCAWGRQLVKHDPQAALDLAEGDSFGDLNKIDLENSYLPAVLNEWAYHDLAGFQQYLDTSPAQDWGEILDEEVVDKLASGDMERTLSWLGKQDHKAQRLLGPYVLSRLATSDLSRALELIPEIAGRDTTSDALQAIVKSVIREDPVGAYQALIVYGQAMEAYKMSVGGKRLPALVVETDLIFAAQELTHADSYAEEKVWANTFADHWQRVSPPEGLAWAQSLADPEWRARMTRMIHARWYEVAPEEASDLC